MACSNCLFGLQNKINNENIKQIIMSDHQSGDSDQQGFIPNQIEVKRYFREEEDKSRGAYKIFQTHYLLGTPMLRKEARQCYERIKDFPIQQQTNVKKLGTRESKQQKLTVSQRYMFSGEYELVYSRQKQPFCNGTRNQFENEITLKSVFNNQGTQYYRPLREYGSDKSEIQMEQKVIFDSRFESGNMRCVFQSKKQPDSYYCFMQNDSNTYGYNQWFYYSIKNAKPNKTYTFRIVNFKKRYSFFKLGMKPVFFSLQRARKTGNGWYRGGNNIRFYQSNIVSKDNSPYYTLQFDVTFQYENDDVTVSPFPPYSYSKLIYTLKNFIKVGEKNGVQTQLKPVACSLGGTSVPYLILSLPNNGAKKPVIVIFGRQHSGQVWSSYLMQQLLDELVNRRSAYTVWLLQTYDFHIFPMVNVDGVIYGNFRCDIAGNDLNRCWKDPSQTIHPQIYKIKQILQQLVQQTRIDVCLDLHNHSRDIGVFAYCCGQQQVFRALPYQISKLSQLFRYRSCTFGITAYKRTTARATLFQMSKNTNILTIQMSCYGFFDSQTKNYQHFNVEHVQKLAVSIIEAIYLNINKDSQFSREQLRPILNEADDDQPISGSDSQPEVDQISVNVRLKTLFPKKIAQNVTKKFKTSIKKYANKTKVAERWQLKTEYKQPKITKKLEAFQRFRNNTKKQDFIVKGKYIQQPIQNKQHSELLLNTEQKTSKQTQFSNEYSSRQRKKLRYYQLKRNEEKEEKQFKPLNMLEFSLKKLPIFTSQTVPQANNQILHQNQSLMLATMTITKKFKQQRNRVQKTLSHYSNLKKTEKVNSIFNQNSKCLQMNSDPIQFLCIMSQNKKKTQLQKKKQRQIDKKMDNKIQVSFNSNEYNNDNQKQDEMRISIQNKKQSLLRRLAKERVFLDIDCFSRRMNDSYSKKKFQMLKTEYKNATFL